MAHTWRPAKYTKVSDPATGTWWEKLACLLLSLASELFLSQLVRLGRNSTKSAFSQAPSHLHPLGQGCRDSSAGKQKERHHTLCTKQEPSSCLQGPVSTNCLPQPASAQCPLCPLSCSPAVLPRLEAVAQARCCSGYQVTAMLLSLSNCAQGGSQGQGGHLGSPTG